MDLLWDLLFGCSYRNLSLPITVRKRSAAGYPSGERETYCVCLECGRKFPYSWGKNEAPARSQETTQGNRENRQRISPSSVALARHLGSRKGPVSQLPYSFCTPQAFHTIQDTTPTP